MLAPCVPFVRELRVRHEEDSQTIMTMTYSRRIWTGSLSIWLECDEDSLGSGCESRFPAGECAFDWHIYNVGGNDERDMVALWQR